MLTSLTQCTGSVLSADDEYILAEVEAKETESKRLAKIKELKRSRAISLVTCVSCWLVVGMFPLIGYGFYMLYVALGTSEFLAGMLALYHAMAILMGDPFAAAALTDHVQYLSNNIKRMEQ